MQWIYQFSQSRVSWFILAFSAFALFISALYFQHVLDFAPCVKCIDQRTAVIGIFLAGVIGLLSNNAITRWAGFAVWGYSAYSGLMSANAHIDVIYASNPLFAPCDIAPSFPSFMPLHEWLPAVFGATGECNDNRWQFMDLGMAEWLQIIFIAYLVVLVIVVLAQFFGKKTNAQ
ncbi:disulfide bond formation protein DsbB [Glaciecola petra]|uniref:Disulfide bond formation protein B n=1 Tax=Glaciecola petra TaxID=3075602 RepID=A0ABU2ZNF4_9ALTE|nr:disulfide bond formation protein DsbB [Aestuariibacter sp. P117]MDT0593946.1 disulfide bond formation protein DsbB [Aestuariibacter sp. P117]